MLKHCSPSSVDLRRRSRRNLLNEEEDCCCDTSTTSSAEMFKHSAREEEEEELDLCEDEISVRSFSSLSDHRQPSSRAPVLPKSRIVGREPSATPLKVYARCLRSDIEYKTLIATSETSCRDLIWMLLSKYRMRHRDPKLFYLTMDIYIKRTGIPLKRTLSLEDEARPAELKSCHPWGECKFTLQMRKGGLVRIHDSILMAESKYKCLLISEHTTARDVIKLLFHCYGLESELEDAEVDKYCLFEHIPPLLQRKLDPDECPVHVQSQWSRPDTSRLVLRIDEEKQLEASVFARPATIIEDDEEILDTSYCSSGESTASSEFSALRFRDSPMSSSSRSNTSMHSALKAEEAREPVKHLYKKNSTTLISCSHHKGMRCSQLALARHYSLSSLLEALPAASVDDPHHSTGSVNSLSSDSWLSDFDGYFYI